MTGNMRVPREDSAGAGSILDGLDSWLPLEAARDTLIIEGERPGSQENVSAKLLRLDSFRQRDVDRRHHVEVHEPEAADHDRDARSLIPYITDRFDLVILAFVSASMAVEHDVLAEISRILSPGGKLLIIDLLVPGSRQRGKKARRLREAGGYVNTWMRLWNRQHKAFLSRDRWEDILQDVHMDIERSATCIGAEAFRTWESIYKPTPDNATRLQAMLVQAPEKVQGFLTPLDTGDRMTFHMTEISILATMAGDSV